MRARFFAYLHRFLRHRRFPYLVALLGFADMFCFVLPNDLLVLSEALASPQRRRSSVLIVSLGSALGALAFAFALRGGTEALLYFQPGASAPGWWAGAKLYFERYGEWALALSALAPFPVQPFIAGAAFSGAPLVHVFALVFAGRMVKYSVLAFLPAVAMRFLPARMLPTAAKTR